MSSNHQSHLCASTCPASLMCCSSPSIFRSQCSLCLCHGLTCDIPCATSLFQPRPPQCCSCYRFNLVDLLAAFWTNLCCILKIKQAVATSAKSADLICNTFATGSADCHLGSQFSFRVCYLNCYILLHLETSFSLVPARV